MQIGESVAAVMAMQKAGKCVICSAKHKDPKKEKVTKTAGKTGWKRVTMSSKFEQIRVKLAIYPNNSFPPPYKREGHHCLALSAFVANESTNPKDVFLRLNYFLDKTGYSPNRHENSIVMPGRPQYDAFWEALEANKPLQMHIGDHDDSFMTESTFLLIRLISFLTDPDACKQSDQAQWEDELKSGVAWAENYAFKKLASNSAPWRLHPVDHKIAIEVYFMSSNRTETFDRKGGKKITLTGLGHRKKDIKWPNPELDVGPFG